MRKKIQTTVAFLADHKADIMALFDEKRGISKEDFETLYDNDEIYCEFELRKAAAELHDELSDAEIEVLHQEELDKHFIEYCDGYYISK